MGRGSASLGAYSKVCPNTGPIEPHWDFHATTSEDFGNVFPGEYNIL